MPPEPTPGEEREYLDSLTPERAEEVATSIAEQWQRDWGTVLELVAAKTGLSRNDAFQFMLLRQMAMISNSLANGIQPKYHPDCEGCRREKEFHEKQWEVLQLTIRHLKEELGEEWKDEE